MLESQRIHVMTEEAVHRALARMAWQIIERNEGVGGLSLMGIHRRGVELSELLHGEIQRAGGVRVPRGSLDITMYRDDLHAVGPKPLIGESELPSGGVDNRAVVVVDDVIHTGRTARAAINELMSWGRPSRIFLCVLVDRGGRELPIQPDVVGRRVRVLPMQRVEVMIPPIDSRLGVDIITVPPEAA
jgi:pyrimidine operon attenuation protein/uracil phosphoribosyltransferase